MNLKEGDIIITAYAESAAGPGWANSPLWIVVRDLEGVMRMECLQPDEQTQAMRILYYVSQEVHQSMKRAVEDLAPVLGFQKFGKKR